MAESRATSEASLRKGLPWLKLLQGELDDDDSSDSSSQSTKRRSKKLGRMTTTRKKKKPEKEGRRVNMKRLRQQEGNDSDDESLERRHTVEKETPRRVRNQFDKTGTLTQRKRFEKQSKECKQLNSTKAVADQAVATREQRNMQLLYGHQAMARANDRRAEKLPHEKVSEALKGNEKGIARSTQSVQNELTNAAGKEVVVEVYSERRRRLSLRLTARRNSTDEYIATKQKQRKTASLSTMKKQKECVDSFIVSSGSAPDSLKQNEEDNVGPSLVAEATAAESTKHDSKKEELMTTPELIEPIDYDDVVCADVTNNIIDHEKPKRNGEPERTPPYPEEGEINLLAKAKTTEKIKKLCSSAKREKGGASQESLVAAMTLNVTPGDSVKNESHAIKTEPLADKEVHVELVKEECSDERQAESSLATQDAKEFVENEVGAESNSSEEKSQDVVLEMVPIPRKMAGDSTAFVTAESFVIPKRSFGNNDQTEEKVVTTLGRRARIGEYQATAEKNLLGPSVSVTMLPLPSPGSSPKLLKVAEPICLLPMRLKKPVPIKTTSISMQDRALMRLSRKRNSIFMGAMELAAQASGFRSNKRMMGYEVYDIDGKALPDLIPRLSCATKREMALNKESYTASFFGVSLPTPKAIDKTSFAIDECGNKDLDTRKINCYEELRFSRSEDREFYQRRMYGTAFVPQNIRGWITLVVRNARFERKSTGIRFNQDRDREEFASSLSKRYTLNKSVPRCDVSRENWHKLMRNQPGSVYLHYYNREDAEQASHIFRDDLGHPLELKLNLKAGVMIRTSSSSVIGPRPQQIPRRSNSSERSVPKSSPLSSQNGSERNTSSWRRKRESMTSDIRYSRHDRGGPWSRGDRRYNEFDGGKRSHAMIECRPRSRSRSRSKSFCGRQNGSGVYEGRFDQGNSERNRTPPSVPDARETIDNRTEPISSIVYSDADTQARKRARLLPRSPRRSPTFGQDASKRELRISRRGQENGEVISRSETNSVRTASERDGESGLYCARSPSWRWQQEQSNTELSQRRDHFPKDSCAHSRSPATQHRFNPQRSNWNMDKRRSRSRSRSRSETLSTHRSGCGGSRSDQYDGHRGFWEFERRGGYDDSSRERRICMDRERGGYNGQYRGGPGSRQR